jgi:hypothetical protein
VPRVRFVACDRVGSRLRTWWPSEALAARGWDTECTEKRWPQPGEADVVVVHRPLSSRDVSQTVAHRKAGAVVLVDEDDALGLLPPGHHWTPAAGALAWHDEAIQEATGLIVSTQRLADIYGPLAKRTWVVPNRLPRRIGEYRWEHPPGDTRVRVGWAGIVGTHAHDLRWLAPEARRMVSEALFTSIGDHRTQRALGLLGRIDKLLGFTYDERTYYEGMARADIGIVPLLPCPFNEAKSSLKALEYMALGKPVVATRLPEQEGFIRQGISGFLAGTPAEFADFVQEVVRDQDLRRRMGEAARAAAAELWLEDSMDVLEGVIKEVTTSVRPVGRKRSKAAATA